MLISELIKKLEQFPATENIVAITSNDCFIGPMQAEPDVYFSKSEKKFFIFMAKGENRRLYPIINALPDFF